GPSEHRLTGSAIPVECAYRVLLQCWRPRSRRPSSRTGGHVGSHRPISCLGEPPTQGPDRGTIGARSCALAFFGASPNLSAAVVHPSEKNDEDHTGCAASVRAPVHPPAHRAGAGRGAG